jgi:hypothetical protein
MLCNGTAYNTRLMVRRFAPPGSVRQGRLCLPRLTTPTFLLPRLLRKALIQATKMS